jgi:hypothetical protein
MRNTQVGTDWILVRTGLGILVRLSVLVPQEEIFQRKVVITDDVSTIKVLCTGRH